MKKRRRLQTPEFVRRLTGTLQRIGWVFGFVGFHAFQSVRLVWLLVTSFFEYITFLLFGFLHYWFISRPVRPLLWGLPAVVVGGLTIWVMVLAHYNAEHNLSRTYLMAAYQASRRAEWDKADFYLQRLNYLDAADPATQYNLAVAADQQGDVDRARRLMQSVAPPDRNGYAKAHFWLAVDMAKNQSPFDEQAQALFEHHLKATLAELTDHTQAHVMLGELCMQQQKWTDAARHLSVAARKQKPLLLALAQVYARLHEKGLAEHAARQAGEYFQAVAKADPDNLQPRLMWARTEFFLENPEHAVTILQEGLALAARVREPDKTLVEQYRQTLAAAYVSWFDRVTRTKPKNLTQRLELLQQALRFGPDNVQVLNRLASFATTNADPASDLRQRLRRVLASGRAPATVHFIVGTSELLQDDNESAIRHLELAFDQLPQMPSVANNLAWALAYRKQPDLERAERLADVAVRLTPDHPEFHETRGMIRAKLGKDKQAIVDLEQALHHFPDRARIHQMLAELYQKLGDTQLAQAHRDLGKSLTAKTK